MDQMTVLTSMNREQFKELLSEVIHGLFAENPKSSFQIADQAANEPMVGVSEASKITGLAVNTLYEKTHNKSIPHYKKGKRIYFRPSELLSWITTGKVKTKDEIDAEADLYMAQNPTKSFYRKPKK